MSMRTGTSRVLRFVDESYWAMHPAAYESMRAVLESWAGVPHAAPRLSASEREAAVEAASASHSNPAISAPTTISVFNMFGIIAPRIGMLDVSQEGCSLDRFGALYSRAMNDANIAAVIVNADTPGGIVFQVEETGDLIYSLRDTKPNIVVGTGMVASAGFWLFTQFKERVASPSSDLGSIGVLMRHQDVSKLMEDMGVSYEFITAPRDGHKAEGNPFTPLSEETREHYYQRCEEYYGAFLSALARGSGVKAKKIDAEWGRGRMVGAKTALSLGMVDRIGTLQYEIDKLALMLSKKSRGNMRAEQRNELHAFCFEAERRIAEWEAVRVEREEAAEDRVSSLPYVSAMPHTQELIDDCVPVSKAEGGEGRNRAIARLKLAGS